jgi:hypothetical protein
MRFLWWSDSARPQPDESNALLCCFAAFLHEGEHVCFLVCGDLVFRDVACNALVVVVAVPLDVSPCAYFDFAFPCWEIMRELFAKSFLPCFALCYRKVLILGCILYLVSVSDFALSLLLASAVSFSFVPCVCLLGFNGGSIARRVLNFLEGCRNFI